MSAEKQRVFLYVLDADDGVSTEEKLHLVARRYAADTAGAWSAGDTQLIARTQRGKPYFPHCPQVHVSPSHSGAYFVCAVAGFPVGADVQQHTRLRQETPEETAHRLRRIAHRYFTPGEADFLQTDTCRRFFMLWTARESYVKYTGQGIDGSFESLCVLPEDAGAVASALESGGIAGWRALDACFRQTQLAPSYTLCVCAGRDFSLQVVYLTEEGTE